MLEYESELYKNGIELIGGIDEVGRGPLVGPVVAACVILPSGYKNIEIKDSKKLSEKKRENLYDEIYKTALGIGIGIISPQRIDEINIYEATKEAMIEAIENCNTRPEYLLIDAMKLDANIPTMSIIKGDSLSQSIAAASIIAKVTRDRYMKTLHLEYPEYNFIKNKGYGTKEHIEAIKKYGITKYHRLSFRPVFEHKSLINNK